MDSGEVINNSYATLRISRRKKFCNIERAVQQSILEFKRKFFLLKERLCALDSREKFLDLMRYYELNEHLKQIPEIKRIIRWSLPAAIFESQVEDSWMVQEFLKFLDRDHCENIDLFFTSVMNRSNFSLRDTAHCIPSYMAFFVGHANEGKLTFGGYRMTQVLASHHAEHKITTLLYSRPEAVFALLQYEARLFGYSDEWDDRCQTIFACALEFIIFCGVLTNIWDESLTILQDSLNFSPYMKKMLLNFRALLRVTPNPHEAIRRLSGVRVGSYSVPIPPFPKLQVFFANVYPDSDLADSKTPSLKHSCRVMIRRRLYDNWELPDGIYHLGLPKLIENYLNLQEE